MSANEHLSLTAEVFAPVRRADRADLIREVAAAHSVLAGWGERLAVTRGPDARWLLSQIDAARDAAHNADLGARTVYPHDAPERTSP